MFSQINVCEHGYVQFGTSGTLSSTSPTASTLLPSLSAPRNIIAPFWAPLVYNTGKPYLLVRMYSLPVGQTCNMTPFALHVDQQLFLSGISFLTSVCPLPDFGGLNCRPSFQTSFFRELWAVFCKLIVQISVLLITIQSG